MKGMYFIAIVFILTACKNEDKRNPAEKVQGIYAHYDISANDEDEMATCLARIYTDKSRKHTLSADKIGGVQLDGEPMPMDSSHFSGIYFEMQSPMPGFEGQHTIAYTSSKDQEYEDKFSFRPIRLLTDLSKPVAKSELVLQVEGIKHREVVRMVLLDTAFESDGINQLYSVNNGELVIDSQTMSKLKSGPVILEIVKESEEPLTSGIDGFISSSFTIRRNFLLQ